MKNLLPFVIALCLFVIIKYPSPTSEASPEEFQEEIITVTETSTVIVTTMSTAPITTSIMTSATHEVPVSLVQETEIVTEVVEVVKITRLQGNTAAYSNGGVYIEVNPDIPEEEVEAIAKVVAGECGHLAEEWCIYVIWVIFNRVGDGEWTNGEPNTVLNVINCPKQFYGKDGGYNWNVAGCHAGCSTHPGGLTLEEYREHLRQLVRVEYSKWLAGECCPECEYAATEDARHGYNSFPGTDIYKWFTKN